MVVGANSFRFSNARAVLFPIFAALMFFCIGPRAVVAHPHAWIDLESGLRFNEKGEAVSLSQIWLLDPGYSSFATAGLDKDGDGKPDWSALDALLRENMRNLKKFNYFTEIYQADRTVKFAEIVEMSTRMRADRLEMQFVVPFEKPVRITAKRELHYRIFDPTYYIEVVHAEKKGSFSLTGAPKGCKTTLREPTPDADTVMFAAALDQTQSAGSGLGKFFAETVQVACPAGD